MYVSIKLAIILSAGLHGSRDVIFLFMNISDERCFFKSYLTQAFFLWIFGRSEHLPADTEIYLMNAKALSQLACAS